MLRPYQTDAVFAMLDDLDTPGNSVLSLGTAAGKSHLIAEFVKSINSPVLILCPNREILTQNKEKLLKLVDKGEVGVFSAALNEKTIKLYTFATIGSIFRKPELFSHFRVCIVDECHVVRPDKPTSMYIKLFRCNNFPKCFGLTATPYLNITKVLYRGVEDNKRVYESTTSLQLIYRMANSFWKRIIFNYDAKKLQEEGYTVPVIYKEYHLIDPEHMRLNSNGSEYDQEAFARQVYTKEDIIADISKRAGEKYKSVLVFCANVAQAESLHQKVEGSEVVTAKTPAKQREQIVEKFKLGDIKILFNVSCLTTGFDSPRTDCLICLRPTKSIGLYQQFIGRGVRVSPETGKTHCTVIDLSGTYHRLGAAEDIRLVKKDDVYNLESSSGKLWHDAQIGTFIIRK